jgi:hypothetical protein
MQGRWSMRIRFEPSRLQAAPLVEAYESALPVQRRRPIPPAVPVDRARMEGGEEPRRVSWMR